MKTSTRLAYAQRLDPVLRWLVEHPELEPDLYHLADLACLSPFHFHRVYRAMVGETVAATMQRVRMQRASRDLSNSDVSLRQVAKRAGYDSPAAFSRAFSDIFGRPPGRYRADRAAVLDHQENDMYPITIQDLPALTLATLSYRGDYHAISPVFERLFVLASAHGLVTPDSPGYGLYYDDPEQVPANMLRAAAGVAVPDGTTLPEGLEPLAVPAMRAAVLTYVGPYAEIGAAYQWLFSQWLPDSGHAPGDFPMMEIYLNDPKTTPPAELKTHIVLCLAA